jgi:integrase/recombinase XerD
MPERDLPLPSPAQSQATIFKRLMLGKQTLRTREAYAADLRAFAHFLGLECYQDVHPLATVPDDAWQQLDTAHVAAYLEQLKQTVSPKTGQSYSSATIARRLTAVREFLTEACYLGLYPRERLLYLKERLALPEVTHEHHAGITPEEQTRLLTTADALPGLRGQRDYALFRLWLDTGLRCHEVAALQSRDVTVKEGIPTLIVRRGKGNKLREIGLESYTAHVVRQWLEQSGQGYDPVRPIFCQLRKRGRGREAVYHVVNPEKHLSNVALWKLVRWYAKKAEITSKISPHSFRVAMVTDALDGNAPLQHVQAAGGWSSTRMITAVYDRNRYAEPVARFRKIPLPQRRERGTLTPDANPDESANS